MTTFFVVATAAKLVLFLVGIITCGALMVWVERRMSAMIQDRIGPVRANAGPFRLWGLVHIAADGLKMMIKEDFIPRRADKLLHALAPMLAIFPVLVTFAVVPFGPTIDFGHLGSVNHLGPLFEGRWATTLQVAQVDVGLLFVLAIAGTGVVGAVIAGAASDNRYSLLGSLRAASQLVSYEVTLGLSLVGCVLVFGTLRLEDMVLWQHHHTWGVVVQPLGFVLFLAAAIAESKRTPFDLPEGESEIVAGYFVEYSGMKFAAFYLGELMEIGVLACFLAVFFFGGWDVPFLRADGIHLSLPMLGAKFWAMPHWSVVLLQLGAFGLKVCGLIFLQMAIRWTLPRMRYDQLMELGWKAILPLSLANVAVTAVVLHALR
ncbi:MAG: NADH-quinone oxidoreductase subunit H [Acidobacteria bacterium]|nr:NADH-quinone oxidoreductase subunit H [Acidobacteriota bacterium]